LLQLFFFRNNSRPNSNQLKAGLDGSDTMLLAKKNIYAEMGNEVKMVFGNFQNRTEYFIYSLASNENLGVESAVSEMLNFVVYTDQGDRFFFEFLMALFLFALSY
jgi:hypothetical protein